MLALRVAGFGPFRDEQTVDFEAFDDDGIFLISGRTGAGKSSILDAVCFALYGSVPRYEASDSSLRSDHCRAEDPTFVELEFSIGTERYRVHRTPKFERPKRSGSGTTTAPPTAHLDIADGDGWRGIAAKPVDVGHELASVLPLKQDQFLQVILLAQNRFQRFLLAKTEERRAVLRTLFATARFEQLESSLLARRRVLDTELEAITAAIDGHAARLAAQLGLDAPSSPAPAEWFESAVTTVDAAVSLADSLATAADAVWRTAADALTEATATRERQDRRAEALSRRTRLQSRADAVEAERRVVSRARRAALVWPHVETARAAQQRLDDAWAALARAEEQWRRDAAFGVNGDPATVDSTVVDALLETIGSARSGLDDERAVDDLTASIPGLEREVASAQSRLDESTASRESLPAVIDHLDERIVSLTAVAARLPDHRETVARLTAAIAAAHRALDGESRLATARELEVLASRRHRDTVTAFDDLLSARLSGQAVALAATLESGEPCAVCGSRDHPAPAVSDVAAVSDTALDAARLAADDERREFETASAVVAEAVRARDAAAAESGGRDLGDLESELADAEAALTTATAAADDVATCSAERASRVDELDAVTHAIERDRLARDAAVTALGAATTRMTDIATRLVEHRGEFESIAARLEALELVVGRARALVSARDTVGLALSTADASDTVLGEHVAASDFDDVDDVVAARLPDAELETTEDRIRAHEGELAAALAVLDSPELQGLPIDAVDLDPPRESADAAQTERDDAFARRTAASERAAGVRQLVGDVDRERAASAGLAHEHALVRELAAVVHGDQPNTKRMRLETYVLAARLEEIIDAANGRLRTMTSARYTLELDDAKQYRNTEAGLGIAIRDEHTGRTRPTNSLSGGETFLASLALALGLAEVVTAGAGGVALDTLFVDEGFGSLDSETLEIAMSTLDGLRSGGRTIGLISHVDSMKEQIPAALRITVTAAGHSIIEEHGPRAD
ncbi:AAA family ATPase [Marisediminicola sp. LYQ85]|uniref:AAA family ATPase n=1 Tax=Marisediminicola sp. LYQ85 TaxID=3391062 RepID=UPI003983A3BE